MKTQIENTKKESSFLFVKLYSYLKNATADRRRDIWKTMIVPLFNAVFMLAMFDKSETEVRRINIELLGMMKNLKRYLTQSGEPFLWHL